jgi:hypothetical protein
VGIGALVGRSSWSPGPKVRLPGADRQRDTDRVEQFPPGQP